MLSRKIIYIDYGICLIRPGGPKVSYAESEDGIHWEKPKLGIIDVGGSKQNNVVFDGGFESRWTENLAMYFMTHHGRRK